MTATAIINALKQEPIGVKVLIGLGLLVLGNVATHLLTVFYNRFLSGSKNLKKYGAWAVVTGATDGIGKAMAFEFARKGLNVLIISRKQENLDETSTAIKAKYGTVEVRSVAVDYSTFGSEAQAKVAAAIKDIDIGVLVNNVGISYDFTKYFHELDDARVQQLISLNVESTTYMTRLVLPGMVQRKRGAIVNIGSAAGVAVSPLLAQYGAAKSYIAMFSQALHEELHGPFKLDVQCQVPLFVATKLAKIRKTSLFVPSPTSYARAAVAAIGKGSLISPYWTHALQLWLMAIMPSSLAIGITRSMHLDIRRRGMKKEAAAAAGAAAGVKDPSKDKKQ